MAKADDIDDSVENEESKKKVREKKQQEDVIFKLLF